MLTDRLFKRRLTSNAAKYGEDEKRILEVLRRGLLAEFPNPERVGCPTPKVLQDIATHRLALAQAAPFVSHITACSPCYQDFRRFRDATTRKRRTLLAVAAGVLLVGSLLAWRWFEGFHESQTAQTVVLDLRDLSVARGSQPPPQALPLKIKRTASRLNIYLPLGSSGGNYEVRLIDSSGDATVTAMGAAQLQGQLTMLVVPVAVSLVPPGDYVLQVRKKDSEWISYPVLIH
jgi:hypothetical protein